MKKNRVQSAMDAHLSHLELTTYEKRALLDAATGVAHPHRKRPALLLLLVALVLLLASVAIALSLWNPAVEHAVQEEVRKGSYETWAVSEKLDFLHALAGYGLEMALPDVHGLSEEDADLILTQYIQNRFGDHTSSLAENIAGAEYGMFGLWSLEDKAGYTQLLHTHGLLNPGVPVYYVPLIAAAPS